MIVTGNSDLKMWWPCNEGTGTTLYDASGNGITGTITSGTWVNTVNNQKAVKLTTNAAKITTSSDPYDIGTDNVTCMVWINILAANRPFFLFYNRTDASIDPRFGIHTIDAGSSNKKITIQNYVSSVYNLQTDKGYSRNYNWFHMTIVQEGTTGNFYINGELVYTGTGLTTGDRGSGQGWEIPSENSGYLTGLLKHVMIFGKALSKSEINNIYKETFIPNKHINEYRTW